MPGFFVSRQRYYQDNNLYVEIASGGRKKASPDLLSIRYPEEQKSYKYPSDALKVAVRVYKKWYRQYNTDENIRLSIVDEKLGNLILRFDERDLKHAERWAGEAFKNLVRCEWCNRPLGNPKRAVKDDKLPGLYCNEICASKKYIEISEKNWKK